VKGNANSGRVYRRQRVQKYQGHRLLMTGSRCLIQRLINRRTKPIVCVFPVFSVAVMEWGCDACRDGEYYLRSVFWVSKGAGVSWASTAINRKSMRHTMADRSSNEADFLCILLYLPWRFWKEVVTLAVTGNTISGRIFPFQRVPEFHWYRLLLSGSRCYIQWQTDRRTKPLFCVFPVISAAVLERGCDACRDWEY
jgi:hypothetical protein